MVTSLAAQVVGDGVLLGPWTDDDVPGVLEIADDPATRAWSPSLRPVHTAADARAWLASRTDNPDRYDWAVRDPATGRMIGRVGLHRFDPICRSAEIGYGVHPAHRRGGVAVRAVAAASDYGFGTLDLARIGLIHATGNAGSCGVATRSGFGFEGLLRSMLDHGDGVLHDVHQHARLASDPAGPTPPPPAPLVPVEIPAGGLRLRPWRDDDAPALLAMFADPQVRRWHTPVPGDLAATRGWIARRADAWATGTSAAWAVVDAARAEDQPIGAGLLRGIDGGGAAKATYWVAPAHRRRGVATRTLGALSTYAFEGTGLHRLVLCHALDNGPSCGVAQAAGFALEGTVRGSDRRGDDWVDEHQHARLATDPPVCARTTGDAAP